MYVCTVTLAAFPFGGPGSMANHDDAHGSDSDSDNDNDNDDNDDDDDDNAIAHEAPLLSMTACRVAGEKFVCQRAAGQWPRPM